MQSTLSRHIACASLGSSITSDALRALASVSGCLESFWASIGRSFDSGHVQHAAAQLRPSINTILKPGTDHISWLKRNGYSREDIRQVRYVVEVFCGLEPVFAILASLAKRWLTQPHFYSPLGSPQRSYLIPPSYSGKIELRIDCDDLSCVESIAGKHVQPVHAFFRALAVWPEYARVACDEIARLDGFVEASHGFLLEAESLASRIPLWPSEYPSWCDADAMRRSITGCSEISAEVITAAIVLRNGFIMGEESERDKLGGTGGGGRAR